MENGDGARLWVPVAATCGVVLPRNLALRRAYASEAGDAVSAAGTLSLRRGDEDEGVVALARI